MPPGKTSRDFQGGQCSLNSKQRRSGMEKAVWRATRQWNNPVRNLILFDRRLVERCIRAWLIMDLEMYFWKLGFHPNQILSDYEPHIRFNRPLLASAICCGQLSSRYLVTTPWWTRGILGSPKCKWSITLISVGQVVFKCCYWDRQLQVFHWINDICDFSIIFTKPHHDWCRMWCIGHWNEKSHVCNPSCSCNVFFCKKCAFVYATPSLIVIFCWHLLGLWQSWKWCSKCQITHL